MDFILLVVHFDVRPRLQAPIEGFRVDSLGEDMVLIVSFQHVLLSFNLLIRLQLGRS